MTDQRNIGHTPEPSDEQQPYRPPQRRETARWSDDGSNQRFPGQSTGGARPAARSPLGSHPGVPSPGAERAAPPQGGYDTDPQRRAQPRQPASNLPPAYLPPTPNGPAANRTPPSRLPFWIGFVISFLFLSAVSLGILLLSTGADRFDLASLQGSEAAWVPSEILPTPTPDPALADTVSASSSGEQYGSGTTLRNVTNTNVRIRQSPGHQSKPEGDIIGGIPASGQVAVIGGPVTADGLTWWQIRYTNNSGQVVEGWSAEVTPSGVRILAPDQ